MNDKPFQAVIADFHLYSPEGHGQIERAFGALRQRLPPELRRAGMGRGSGLKTLNRAGFLFVPALAYW
jgi:hypothetical protein